MSQNVGIGITQPKAGLQIINENGLLANGTVGAGADLTEVGAGATRSAKSFASLPMAISVLQVPLLQIPFLAFQIYD